MCNGREGKMKGDIMKSPEKILQRLEELRKWQEQQQQLLIQRQNSQRQLLDEEQRILYERLGFSSPKNSSSSISQPDKELNETTPEERSSETMGTTEKITYDYEGISSGQRKPTENEHNVVKRKFLKKGEGIVHRFKVNPDQFRLHNLPKYKYSLRSEFRNKKPSPETLPRKFATNTARRVDERAGNNAASKVQTNHAPVISEKLDDKSKMNEGTQNGKPGLNCEESLPTNSISLNNSTPISWADVLNPNNVKTISLEGLKKYANLNSTETSLSEDCELENLSLFELLEKKAQEGSILIDSSVLKRWVENLHSPGNKTDEESKIRYEEAKSQHMTPFPCDVAGQLLADESEESSIVDEKDNECELKYQKQRVRFSEAVIINDFNSGSEDEGTLVNSNICIDESSAPFRNTGVERKAINSMTSDYDTLRDMFLSSTLTSNPMSPQQSSLMEKADLLKTRLADLEHEIAEFQRQNAELIKLKQECENEKLRLSQELEEVDDKLKDERIKLEIQLHDERMKLDSERKKYERLIREHRSKSKKESEEMSQLKDQLSNLQKESREKDAKHSNAQARMRAQLRNVEKELKEANMEIDVLKKEKKRLENENNRLMRQSSNKMLHEINKSIAKLVPQNTPADTEVNNKSTKPVVARVTSHLNKPPRGRLSKGKPAAKAIANPSVDYETSDESDCPGQNRSSYFKDHPRADASDDPSGTSESEPLPETAKSAPGKKPSQTHDELKRELINPDGSKDIWYTNGNLKKISADGMLIRMLYYNKDIKETNINEGTVKYYYAETNTWHTTYLDGLEILEFPNGQTEHRYKDGTVEVHFENGAIRITNPADPAKEEEWRYADGTKLVLLKTGDKILSFPNGQKEIHTKMHKRREYPDGTVKIVYPDGSQETRYSNGRVRLKDKDGNLIMDSEQ